MDEVKYVEVKRKANVGERIRVVAIHPQSRKVGNVKVGEEFTASYVDNDGDVLSVKERLFPGLISPNFQGLREYVVLEPVTSAAPSAPTSLNFTELLTQFLRDNADEVRKIIGDTPIESVEVADNNVLTRAKAIAQAKADVACLVDEDGFAYRRRSAFNTVVIEEFVIDREKRTVVVLGFDAFGNRKKRALGIAKCAPGEVFNADIGKAISLRRALGLTVPDEYLNAPQPDEPRVGAVVAGKYPSGYYRDDKRFTLIEKYSEFEGTAFKYADDKVDFMYESDIGVILDDTDVDYSANETEVAA